MFVKLYSAIIMSSIWDEDTDTRLLWITMLALADKNGYVRGTVAALARAARLSEENVKAGLAILEKPDPSSKTPDNEGRRIEAVPGGYMILNYPLYRERQDNDARRAYMREYMRKRRAAQRGETEPSTDVNTELAPLGQAEADTEAEAETTPCRPSADGIPKGWCDQVCAWWNDLAKRHRLPQVVKLTASRRKKLNTRYGEWKLAGGWEDVLGKVADEVAAKAFLRGTNNRGWRVSLDWLIENDRNWCKVAEGTYSSGETQEGKHVPNPDKEWK